ncbi:MAG TPA: translocation/assembly module TamB domain-containing protein [Thermoanaerobaculia bacterium]|nr:translocation/assembly module TamB domain-containing protein [Thermoanaerobaculia bacterium]
MLFALLLAGAFVFVESRYARQSVADLLMARLSESLGRTVTIGAVDFDLLTPTPALELYNLVIPGPRLGEQPVLRAAQARVQIRWDALYRKLLDFEQIELIRPRIYLRFDPDGSSNLPQLRPNDKNAPQRFQFRFRHVLLQDGTFQLNERRSPLDLRAQAVWGRAEGRPGAGSKVQLDLLLTAQDVSLTLPNARAYPLALSVKGSLGSGRLAIAGAQLAGPDLSLRTAGTISWAKQNAIDLGFSAHAAAGWVNRVGYTQEPIAGQAELAGRFFRHGTVWGYSGALSAPQIDVLHRTFRELSADFTGDAQRLRFEVRRALFDEGVLSGPVVIETGAPASPQGGRPVALDLLVSGMGVQAFLADQFPRQFAGPKLPLVLLAGRATGRVQYRFQSSRPLLGTGKADLSLGSESGGSGRSAGGTGPGGRWRGTGLPLAGIVPLTLAGGILAGGAIQLTAPGQEVAVSGFTYDLIRGNGRLDYRLASRDTGGLAPLFPSRVAGAAPPPAKSAAPSTAPGEPPTARTSLVWLPARGRGTVAGAVAIDPRGYSARVDLDLGQVAGELGEADRLHGTLTVEPLAIENLRLEAARGPGALLITGRIPLALEGQAEPDQPLQMAIDASQWPAPGLAPYLPAWMLPEGLSGVVSGRLDLGGNFERLTGRADADVERLAFSGVEVGRLRGQLIFDPAHFAVEGGSADTPAGKVVLRGTYDRVSGALDATAEAPALALAAQPFAGLFPGAEVTGRLALMAAWSGTLDHPRATLSLRGREVAIGGRALAPPPASGNRSEGAASGNRSGGAASGAEGAAAAEVQALVSVEDQVVTVHGSLANLLAFEGGGRIDRQRAELNLDVRGGDLGGLLRLAAPPAVPALAGSFAGSLALAADFAAHTYGAELRLADLRLEVEGKEIVNREPVVADISAERLDIRSFYLREPSTDLELFASGSVGLRGTMPLDLHFQSTTTALWAKLLAPNLDLSGGIDVLATLRGTVAEPLLSGQATLHGARLIVPGLPNAIEELEGTALLYRDRLVLDNLSARVGGGTLRATGQLVLPGQGRSLSYRFDLAALGVSLRYPEGWVSRGDAHVTVSGGSGTRQVQGIVDLNRALYVEKLEVDALQLLLKGLHRERLQVAVTSGPLTTTQLNLAINGIGALRVTNNVADLRGDIELTVVGTMATPVLFGAVQLESGGTLVYGDNKYTVERGGLTFANPNRIDPLIDLALKTEVQSYEITLNLSGTLERLNAKFSSNADLADLEILTLLATGQRPEALGTAPLLVGSAAQGVGVGPASSPAASASASAFLAGQAASALSSRVGRLFGLDRFQVDPLSLSAAGAPTTGVVIVAGKRLSKNIFVTYVSNPSEPRLDVRQIEWDAAKNLKVLLTQQGKSYAVDLQRETRF